MMVCMGYAEWPLTTSGRQKNKLAAERWLPRGQITYIPMKWKRLCVSACIISLYTGLDRRQSMRQASLPLQACVLLNLARTFSGRASCAAPWRRAVSQGVSDGLCDVVAASGAEPLPETALFLARH